MDKHRKIWITILTILGIFCLASACFLFIRYTLQDKHAEENLEAMRASAQAAIDESAQVSPSETKPDETASEEMTDAEPPASEEEPDVDPDPMAAAIPNPYRDSFLANKDMAAWLQITDTAIDYPVMWTPDDEIYYLYRDFEGNDNKNGCLILDTDSCIDPLTTNLIVHGHNMRSGTMFGTLTDYEDQNFYETHKQIILYTEECQRNYEVIAVFRSQVYLKTDTVFKYYKFFQADTQEEFDDFYQNIKALSLYDTGVTAQLGDHFLTLSTCAYHVEQGRFVVVAKEVESGDSYLPLQE